MTSNSKNSILIVANPKSGSKDRSTLVAALKDRLIESGFDVEIVHDLDLVRTKAEGLLAESKLRVVIAAGGDGTAAAVADRLNPQVPIGIFPLGTENLLSKSIGMTVDTQRFANAVLQMNCCTIDAATANGKLSLIMIGVGFDAEVVQQVHVGRKGHITKLSYAWPIFKSALTYQFPRLTIRAYQWNNLSKNESLSAPLLPLHERTAGQETDDVNVPEKISRANVSQPYPGPLTWSARWLFIANIPNYAGSMSIVPHAQSDDGYLCAATFRQGGRPVGLSYVASIYFGFHVKLSDYRSVRAKRFLITADQEACYQIDGDFGGYLPLEIQVLPARVCLLTPAE